MAKYMMALSTQGEEPAGRPGSVSINVEEERLRSFQWFIMCLRVSIATPDHFVWDQEIVLTAGELFSQAGRGERGTLINHAIKITFSAAHPVPIYRNTASVSLRDLF